VADTVHVPGVKKPLPGWAVFAGLGGVGVAIVLYYRSHKASTAATTAASSASTTDQYPPDGTTGNPSDPYSTDPATGQTYGDEAAGSGSALGAYGAGAASGLYYDPATGAYDLTSPYGTDTSTSSAGGPPFSSNAAWAAWVIQEEQNLGAADIGAWQNALGLYLEGQPVDAAQKQMIFDARGIAGDPPVAGTGNYPPNIRTSTGGKQTATNPVTGIKATPNSDGTGVTITWDKSTGATGYQVNTFAGSTSFSKHTVTGTTITLSGMKAGVNYTTSVEATPAAAGTKPAAVTYTTKTGSGGGGGGTGGGGTGGGKGQLYNVTKSTYATKAEAMAALGPVGKKYTGVPMNSSWPPGSPHQWYLFPELGLVTNSIPYQYLTIYSYQQGKNSEYYHGKYITPWNVTAQGTGPRSTGPAS
jgi:fibronectin type III domain protein